jgi:ferredoxin
MIRSKSFSGAALSGPQSTVRKGKIQFARFKKTVEWDGGKMDCKTILEIAAEAGYMVEYGCRVGSCGGCKASVVSGLIAGGM